ncbi:MAG: Ig-like domain-containing protein [Candidatus Hydrogenedentes bacterium]|nr:Ig-like domain-containing protein [Candidatus Hydrogenedentota bacterium]
MSRSSIRLSLGIALGVFAVGCPLLRGVTVTPKNLAMLEGEMAQLSASSRDPKDTSFTWSSGNPGVATVDNTGKVTAVAEGTATITATGTISLAAGNAEVSVAPAPEPTMGETLLEFITKEDPYDEWTQFPDAQGSFDSSPPHGPKSRVFINGVVNDALAANFTGSLPDGSIIVKESFDENMVESGDSLTVMWKVDGFNPDANDWFWSMNSSDGKVLAEGKIQGCISCHGIRQNNDFIFLHTF